MVQDCETQSRYTNAAFNVESTLPQTNNILKLKNKYWYIKITVLLNLPVISALN